MKIIDPHLHFFALQAGEYNWLKEENPPFWPLKHMIRQDYDESSVFLDSPLKLGGYVHIEAGYNNQSSWKEVKHWQDRATLDYRGVQCADITSATDEFKNDIDKGLENSSLIGVRHIIDSSDVLLHGNALPNLRLLANLNMIFELQCDLKCVETTKAVVEILEKIPTLSISLNHLGFIPKRNTNSYRAWLSHFKAIVQHPKFGIKVSGLEMRQQSVSSADILWCLDTCLNEAPISSIMMASNFPLVTFTHSYQQYWQTVIEMIESIGINPELLVAENAHQQYFARQITTST